MAQIIPINTKAWFTLEKEYAAYIKGTKNDKIAAEHLHEIEAKRLLISSQPIHPATLFTNSDIQHTAHRVISTYWDAPRLTKKKRLALRLADQNISLRVRWAGLGFPYQISAKLRHAKQSCIEFEENLKAAVTPHKGDIVQRISADYIRTKIERTLDGNPIQPIHCTDALRHQACVLIEIEGKRLLLEPVVDVVDDYLLTHDHGFAAAGAETTIPILVQSGHGHINKPTRRLLHYMEFECEFKGAFDEDMNPIYLPLAERERLNDLATEWLIAHFQQHGDGFSFEPIKGSKDTRGVKAIKNSIKRGQLTPSHFIPS